MARYDYDIAIIGGGAAGLTVAAGAARIGAKAILFEKEKELGGDCLHYGCVPSKTLIGIARLNHLIKHSNEFGLPPTQAERVQFSRVSEKIKSVISTIQKHDSVERFCRLGAKVAFGRPEFSDEHSVMLDGKRISASKWVIATGSSPSIPPFKGLDSTRYLTNKEIFYLDNLPKSMIILGAGPIAIEMAQAFNRLGTAVTVIQRSGQILSKEDKDMAEAVLEALTAEGVTVCLNATVEEVRESEQGRKVVAISQQGAEQPMNIEADELLVAMGRRPNIEGLNLDSIGVEVTRKGIVVDRKLRSSHKHIYAAGDVIGRYLFTHAAGYEGGVVVSNALFHFPRKVDYTFMPWCTYCDPELASIGMNEKRAKEAGIEYSVYREFFRDNDRALASFSPRGMIKLLLDHKKRPIGCQILGPQAGELISYWACAFSSKASMASLAGAVLPYPTLSEINKRIAGDIISEKIFSNTMKKGLKFFFGFKGRACTPESGEKHDQHM